jgi:hypothetical protein
MDTDCYCVCCEGLVGVLERRTDTKFTVFVVNSWRKIILKYLILNVTVFVVKVWGMAIERDRERERNWY